MENSKSQTVYLAGGCFWGIEKLMHSIPGVIDASSGYANGANEADANYKTVCVGNTGFRETVQVTYDPAKVSLDALLLAFFCVVDTTQKNRQGNDVGSQYQAGVYYEDEATKATVERVAALEAGRVKGFAVEIGPLHSFYPAEEYHQRYLDKNPGGYCHIPAEKIRRFSGLSIDPGEYRRPTADLIREKLTGEQFAVTQGSGTERPFSHPYWNQNKRGIYVDIVTGEPLFSSADKYESACGWPAFSAPIEEPVVITRRDDNHGMLRTEVRSRAGDSHLGHIFEGDAESPSGVRYCINGASLQFIPHEEMKTKGYGYLLPLLK